MFRRVEFWLLVAAITATLGMCGCRSGGGPEFLQAKTLFSAFSLGESAPAGQTEPSIVLQDDKNRSER